MLMLIAFLMFAALIASWLIIPDGEREAVTSMPEKMASETATAPAHA